jgi:glycosyltransferase involved in cell wall biosynthesis
MKRIRVLKFLNHFGIGGTERQFVETANGLDASKFDVEIACFKAEGALLETVRPETPVHSYRVAGSFYGFRSLLSQLQLAKDVRERRIDILHTYGWYPNVFGIPAGWFAVRPILIASMRDAGAYMTRSKVRAFTLTCALADCVVANSGAGKEWLVSHGVSSHKIEVIRNGVALPASIRGGRKIRQELGIPEDTPLCACIGRVVSGKGIDAYLRAARILLDQNRTVRFLMIGAHSAETNYKSEMQALAGELGLNGHVIFTGERTNVSDILSEIDIVVHPSLTEGLSNVILEAMAAGVPVVATRVGGNPELVKDGHTGLLVPPDDPTALAHAIGLFLDSPEIRRKCGAAGRERIAREFSIAEMLRKTEQVYLRLLAPK